MEASSDINLELRGKDVVKTKGKWKRQGKCKGMSSVITSSIKNNKRVLCDEEDDVVYEDRRKKQKGCMQEVCKEKENRLAKATW